MYLHIVPRLSQVLVRLELLFPVKHPQFFLEQLCRILVLLLLLHHCHSLALVVSLFNFEQGFPFQDLALRSLSIACLDCVEHALALLLHQLDLLFLVEFCSLLSGVLHPSQVQALPLLRRGLLLLLHLCHTLLFLTDLLYKLLVLMLLLLLDELALN